jgi:hypothetical protein
MSSFIPKEVIGMNEENQDMQVLDEGVEAGVVMGCCTAGPSKA